MEEYLVKVKVNCQGATRRSSPLGCRKNITARYNPSNLALLPIILILPPPYTLHIAHTIAILSHGYCAIYEAPRPPLCMPYTIQYWQLQYRVQTKSKNDRQLAPVRGLPGSALRWAAEDNSAAPPSPPGPRRPGQQH